MRESPLGINAQTKIQLQENTKLLPKF